MVCDYAHACYLRVLSSWHWCQVYKQQQAAVAVEGAEEKRYFKGGCTRFGVS